MAANPANGCSFSAPTKMATPSPCLSRPASLPCDSEGKARKSICSRRTCRTALFYLFTGRKSGKAIIGKIELRSAADRAEILAEDVTLRTLDDLLDSRPGSGARLGHYSNLEYIEESGDLIGSEVWIASGEEKAIGFIVFYESYWGEATQTPLAMNRLSRTPLGWSFELESFGIQGRKTGKYRLQTTHDGAILYRLDIDKETRNGIRLKVRRRLGQTT